MQQVYEFSYDEFLERLSCSLCIEWIASAVLGGLVYYFEKMPQKQNDVHFRKLMEREIHQDPEAERRMLDLFFREVKKQILALRHEN